MHRSPLLMVLAMCLSWALSAQTGDAKSHYDAGEQAIKVGRWVDAGREFEEAAHLAPDNPRYQARYNEVRIEASKWAESAARIYLSLNNLQSAHLMSIQALHFDIDNQSAAKTLNETNERLAARSTPAQPSSLEIALTNNSLVEMAKLGLSAEVILAKIRSTGNRDFDTSISALGDLRAAGVPDAVLVYLVENYSTRQAVPPASPAMDDAGSGRFRWAANEPGTDQILIEGHRYYSITAHGITVRASVGDTGWKTRADVVIINNSGSRIEVDPAQCALWVVGMRAHPLKYQKPEALVASVSGKARIKAALLVFSASGARSTYTSSTSVSGSVSGSTAGPPGISFHNASFDANATTVTTGPDRVAQVRANQLADRLIANAMSDAEYIQEITLKANTVIPGDYRAGAVYFDRTNGHKAAILTVMAGGYAFEFPVQLGS